MIKIVSVLIDSPILRHVQNANLHINILTRRISARYVNRSVDKVTVSGKENFVTNLNTVFGGRTMGTTVDRLHDFAEGDHSQHGAKLQIG